ncbi:hypothetical protein QFC22_005335 [Naganishia vaughanmartiniae]|uniref:Uncharacterized protein n=1 Tax=Naganishia vaughanmartiniae TaxID=1424756 RepID=A0ACC2WWU9_9TREE|nr:hypothetical protein QFC22_005335 [Naganishia vaughanmartiniae]
MLPNNPASTRKSTTNLSNNNANQSLIENPKMDPNNIDPVKATYGAGALTGSHESFTGKVVEEEEEAPVSLFALAAAAIANVDNHQNDSIIPEDESVLALARLGGLGGQMWAYKDTVESSSVSSSYSSSSPWAGGGPQWL